MYLLLLFYEADSRPATKFYTLVLFLANTTLCPGVGPTLRHRLRRWPNIGPTPGQSVVFAGLGPYNTHVCLYANF